MDISADKEQARTWRALAPSQAPSQDVAPGGRDLVAQLPPAIAPLFSNPPVLRNEDANAYRELLNEVAATMRPKDLIEFLWLRDFTDLTWEILRYRRLQKTILETAEPAALRARFRSLIENGTQTDEELDRQAATLAHAWRVPETRKRLEETRPDAIKDEDIAAEAFLHRIKELESLDKLLSAAETRRNKVLREIDSRRESFGYRAQLAEIATRSPDGTESDVKRLPGRPGRETERGT